MGGNRNCIFACELGMFRSFNFFISFYRIFVLNDKEVICYAIIGMTQ